VVGDGCAVFGLTWPFPGSKFMQGEGGEYGGAMPAQRATRPAGWAEEPWVSTITLFPLLLVLNQLAVITFLGKRSEVVSWLTIVITVRWTQRAVPEARTHSLPLPLAS